ncbi:transcriptional regulator PpsR [Mesorhizobium sp. VNQ89]|uniref:transcriptional regulator PpsR n=1 Tax=Mesorhizobium quangtriensis TaxID=3157709 RepID=UPI0032B79DF2
MDKQVSREVSRSFRSNNELFSGLGADALGVLAAANSDLALVIARDNKIIDVAYRDRSLKAWDVDEWVGKSWKDTVTVESRDKTDELLQESLKTSPTPSRQVNHPAKSGRDLPIGYRLVSFSGWPHKVALGTDLRPMAEMQQRLVRLQIEMEKDYRKLRDIESRYRILFHVAVEPLIVVEAQTLKILDANDGAVRLLDRSISKLVGKSAATVFAKADQPKATEALTALGLRARAEVFHARPATSDNRMKISVTPFREFGRTNLLVSFSSDEKRHRSLGSQKDATLVSMIDQLPEGVVIVNADGKITQANPAFLDMVRVVDLDRVEDKGLDNWLGGSSVDLQVLMSNLREHGTVRRFSSVIRDELGGSENVDVTATRIDGPEGTHFGFAVREQAHGEQAQAGGFNLHPGSSTQFTDLVGRVPLKDLVRDTADVIERLCIEAALRLTDNNRASAADMLGLSRQSLYIKLKRYGISDAEDGDD